MVHCVNQPAAILAPLRKRFYPPDPIRLIFLPLFPYTCSSSRNPPLTIGRKLEWEVDRVRSIVSARQMWLFGDAC